MDKRARRRDCFARIKALSAGEKASRSEAIVGILDESEMFQNADTVFAYLALSGEPDLEALFGRNPRKRWAFSRVDENGSLEFHLLENRASLLPGGFGILEPDPDQCPAVPIDEAELILVPGVSFDIAGGARLGRGKGHYDRYLSRTNPRPPLVGVCFSAQISELIPESHDVPMNAIVTENGWHIPVPRAD